MDILTAIKKELNVTSTWNGDTTYLSTLNHNLDFFGSMSHLRYADEDEVVTSWLKAYDEDKTLAVKNLFYLRDIQEGAGNRKSFRSLLVKLSNLDPTVFGFVVKVTPELGRWDDLTKILPKVTNRESRAILVEFVKNQLVEDVKNLNEGKSVSLLAKWMPSLNNKKLRPIGFVWMKELLKEGTKPKVYQKTLVNLREKIDLIETHLTENDFTFKYSHVPAKASLKYKQTFIKKDEKRYSDFIESIKKDKTVIESQAKSLQPHEVLEILTNSGAISYYSNRINSQDIEIANTYWEALPREGFAEDNNTIVVRDGSGSMIGKPLVVATAMSIFASEQLKGPFKNKFITFSDNPKLVELPEGATLYEKVKEISRHDEVSSTNIDKTFKVIYEANRKANKEDRIQTIMIISDMEFNRGSVSDQNPKSTFDKWREKFTEAGMEMPKVIFWNVNVARTVFPSSSIDNLYLVGGLSKSIMTDAMNGKAKDAVSHMKDTLSKYDKYFEEK